MRISALRENFICLRLQRAQGCGMIGRWFGNATIDERYKGQDWYKG